MNSSSNSSIHDLEPGENGEKKVDFSHIYSFIYRCIFFQMGNEVHCVICLSVHIQHWLP